MNFEREFLDSLLALAMGCLTFRVLGSQRSLRRTASGTLGCGTRFGATGAGEQCFDHAECLPHAPVGHVGKPLAEREIRAGNGDQPGPWTPAKHGLAET